MATLAELKEGFAPLAKKKTETEKKVRFEIDLEKTAKALLNEPVDAIEKADDNTDADDLAKSLTGRIEQIESLLEKAVEDDNGRVFVTVDADDPVAKEFALEAKAGHMDDKPKKKAGDEGEETDTAKADDDGEVSWEADLAGKADRRRKLTKSEQVVSTDPSHRRADRIAKRDLVRDRKKRSMVAGD